MKFSVISNLTFLYNSPLSRQFDLHNIQDIKAALMRIISAIVDRNSWFQGEAARILKIDQPGISRIKRLKIAGFSLERLLLFLHRLNCDVNLVIKMQDDVAIIRVWPDIKSTELEIMNLIKSIIAKHNLSQKKVAELIGTDQVKICHINMLKTYHISLGFLLNLLGKMNYHIEFIVKWQTPE